MYIVNARQDIVALFREYEKPAKSLLFEATFPYHFTQERVRENINPLTHKSPKDSMLTRVLEAD
jgi:hypothetical protein